MRSVFTRGCTGEEIKIIQRSFAWASISIFQASEKWQRKETCFVGITEETDFPGGVPKHLGDNVHFRFKMKLLAICNEDCQ